MYIEVINHRNAYTINLSLILRPRTFPVSLKLPADPSPIPPPCLPILRGNQNSEKFIYFFKKF